MDKVIVALLAAFMTGTFALLTMVIRIWFDQVNENQKNRNSKELEELKADIKEVKDIKISKANAVNAKKITTQETLFHYLDAITLLETQDTDNLLIKIQETDQYVRKNKLFIDKSIQTIVYNFLDYYKTVLYNPQAKNFEKEIQFLDDYTEKFVQ